MITILGMALDAAEAGDRLKAARMLWDQVPAWQIRHNWKDASEICGQRVTPSGEPRPCNGLNVEIGAPSSRCLSKSPDGRGLLWYFSGGRVSAYGVCCPSGCPLLSDERRKGAQQESCA